MLWTEKYRPSKLTEIRGQTNFTTDAYNWIEENNMPNLLIYGQYGTGKTAASIVLAKSILKDDFKNNYIEINASDDRNLKKILIKKDMGWCNDVKKYKKYNKLIKITDKNSNTIIDMHNLIYEGRSMKEICNGLHDVVIGSTGLDTAQKFKLLRVIGEAEWRSSTMTPKILASWMVGQLL